MTFNLIYLLVFLFNLGSFNGNVSEFNKIKTEAERAYLAEEYDKAIEKYTYLRDSMGIRDENLTANLAHSYFESQNIEQAKSTYQQLTASNDASLRSVAWQQLGVLEARNQKLDEALTHFKNALRSDPQNEEARYNYELTKKKLEEQKDQNQEDNKDQEKQDDQEKKDEKEDQKDQNKQDQGKDQKDQKGDQNKDEKSENKDQQDKKSEQSENEDQKKKDEQKDGQPEQKDDADKQKKEGENKEGEKPEEQKELSEEQMKEMENQPNFDNKEISKEMAEMILQALQNNEKQYLQQLKRKANKPADRSKPDW